MSKRVLVLAIVLVSVVAVPAATPTDAATSGIVFTINCSQDDGYQITQSGTYLLRYAVGSCASSNAIHVLASNVVLDLQGRSIGGNGSGFGTFGILVDGNDVTIRNGTIGDGWDKGIYALGSGIVVKGVVVRANTTGIEVGDQATISGNTIVRNEQRGIQIGALATITGNTIAGNGTDGINADFEAVISKNVITGNKVEGIRARSFSEISGNTVSGNGHGITTFPGTITSKNVVNGNATDGITVGNNNFVKGNKISGNGNSGIVAGGGVNEITKNIVTGNVSDGIKASNGNTIKGNKVNGNHAKGISVDLPFSSSTVVSGNTTFGNKGAGVDTGVDVAGAGSNKSTTDCNPSDMCVPKTIKANFAIGCSNPGVTIDTPGTYQLNGQAEVCSSGPSTAILVTAPNVVIDLQGFGLSANGHGGTGIQIAVGASQVTVRNGVIHGGFATPIEVDEDGSAISGVTIVDNLYGIIGGSAMTIAKNTIVRNIQVGISGVTSNIITSNVIGGNGGAGINVTDGATITSNIVAGNGGDGIDVGDGAKISKNQIAGNLQGIVAGDAGTFTANTIKGNDDYGLNVSNHSVISKNTLAGNGSDGMSVQGDSALSKNVVTGSRYNGIALFGNDSTVKGNTARGNIDNGIRVYAPSTGIDVAGNTAEGNFLLGIDADVNPIAVSKVNKAKDNGQAAQCNPESACE